MRKHSLRPASQPRNSPDRKKPGRASISQTLQSLPQAKNCSCGRTAYFQVLSNGKPKGLCRRCAYDPGVE